MSPNKPSISFEFFPSKTPQGLSKLQQTFDTLDALSPTYFSVTYGAGGSTRERTLDVINALHKRSKTPITPHLSCIGDKKEEVAQLLDLYKDMGINRLVALRGDLPSGMVGMGELPFAVDLVKFIREHSQDHFTIKVACYPEMHPQAKSFSSDIDNLVNKFHAGANDAITQFFFNADSYLYLRDAITAKGIDCSVNRLVPGIMPITRSSNLIRFADSCGAEIPRYIRQQLADYGDDADSIRQFGFEVIYKLCERLMREGVPALHFYSMNKVEPNKALIEALGLA